MELYFFSLAREYLTEGLPSLDKASSRCLSSPCRFLTSYWGNA